MLLMFVRHYITSDLFTNIVGDTIFKFLKEINLYTKIELLEKDREREEREREIERERESIRSQYMIISF